MSKILTSDQIRGADKFTIAHEPISSTDLMERAARACFDKVIELFPSASVFDIFCGVGNNGGDGLVLARMLAEAGKDVTAHIAYFSENTSADFDVNFERLKNTPAQINVVKSENDVFLSSSTIVVDALLGTGVTRKLDGLLESVSVLLNDSNSTIVSIDFPTGLFDQGNTEENRAVAVQANFTLTFQTPKLAFLLKENADIVGDWTVLDIGLHQEYLNSQESLFNILTQKEIKHLIHNRKAFSHKGTYGHALIASGSYGKIGATVLCSTACLRTGVGLLTVCIPECGYEILQSTVPEAMVITSPDKNFLSGKIGVDTYDTIGVGPGIDTKPTTAEFLSSLFDAFQSPIVIDADALNLLSKNKDLWAKVPENSILTPHPKEFERLFGPSKNSFDQIKLAQQNAFTKKVIIVLKGRYTAVVLPNKQVFFNTTGNPGMATGGSGDVLTGIITSLFAQKYSPQEAAKIGVYIHGLAGDFARKTKGEEAMIASDIVDKIGEAFKLLHH